MSADKENGELFSNTTLVKDKSESLWRWPVLFFSCLMMIGNYYCYDIPAALHTQMDDYFGDPDDFETLFSLLYTVYSVPNVILPFFGGYFVDKWGVRTCLFIFTGCLVAGQAIFAFGLSIKSWPVMLIGRVIYGFGGESLSVANAAVLSVWFKGKELAFAFGLNLSVARLGSVINNLVSPVLASSAGIQFALWFGVFLCASSMGCVFAFAIIDKNLDNILIQSKSQMMALASSEEEAALLEEEDANKREAHENLRKGLLADEDTGSSSAAASTPKVKTLRVTDNESSAQSIGTAYDNSYLAENRKISLDSKSSAVGGGGNVKFNDVLTFPLVFWIITISCVVVYGCVLPFNNIASALLLERNYFKENPSDCTLQEPYQCESDTNQPLIPPCPTSKWYQPPLPLNITESDVDCTDDYWSDGCAQDYCDKQDDATVKAGQIMSIPYIISATLSPFLGAVVDRFGKRAVIATIAPGVLIAVHVMLGYTDVSPIGPLVGQGMAYSMFAAVIWPSVPLVVPELFVGLAYGVITSVQNCGLASFPLIIAQIYQSNGENYIPSVELFFVLTACVGLLVGIWLNFLDCLYLNNKLNRARPKPGEEEKEQREEGETYNAIRAASVDNKDHARRMSRDKPLLYGDEEEEEQQRKATKAGKGEDEGERGGSFGSGELLVSSMR